MALRMYRTTAVGNAAAAQTATAYSVIKTATDRSLDLKTLNAGSGVAITDDAAGNLTIAAAAAAITSGTITGATITGNIDGDIKRATASVTANANITYADVTGLLQTVVPGTYEFICRLPSTVASGTGGIKYAFHYVTTVLSGIEATGRGFTSAGVAVQHTTTTTDVADLFSQAAVVIFTEITGTMIVTTGGTIQLQMAQNTSNASNTIALLGGSMTFNRIA